MGLSTSSFRESALHHFNESALHQRTTGAPPEWIPQGQTMEQYKIWPGIRNLTGAAALTRYAVQVSDVCTDTLAGAGNCPQTSAQQPDGGYIFNRQPPYPVSGVPWSLTSNSATSRTWRRDNPAPPPTYLYAHSDLSVPVDFDPHLATCRTAINARNFDGASESFDPWYVDGLPVFTGQLDSPQVRSFDEWRGGFGNINCATLDPNDYTGDDGVVTGDYGYLPSNTNHLSSAYGLLLASAWVVDPRGDNGFYCFRMRARTTTSERVRYFIATQDIFFDYDTSAFYFNTAATLVSSGSLSINNPVIVPVPSDSGFRTVDGAQICGVLAFMIIGEGTTGWQARTGITLS